MKIIRHLPLPMIVDNGCNPKPLVDDEGSVSSEGSTFAVVDVPSKALTKPSFSHRRKRVHFEEHRNEYYTNTRVYKEECENLWYSSTEMKSFKTQTVALVKDIYRVEKNHFQQPHSFSNVVLAAYDACCEAPCETNEPCLTKSQRKHLRKWMQVGASRHGLERMCIKGIAADKRSRRLHLVDAVLDLQESLAFQRSDSDEIIRNMSEAISRTSRLFAREVARAQASTR